MPCGVALTRKSHVQKVEMRVDYLNSVSTRGRTHSRLHFERTLPFVAVRCVWAQVDTTIMGSRNGHTALHMWHSLRTKGLEGIKADVAACLTTAAYLRDELTRVGITCRLNDLSSTVTANGLDPETPVACSCCCWWWCCWCCWCCWCWWWWWWWWW